MSSNLLQINPAEEGGRIVTFLKDVFEKQKIQRAAIGVSAGLDSATSLTLLSKVLLKENILALHLPYFDEIDKDLTALESFLKIRITTVSIRKITDELISRLGIAEDDKIRRGNIMTRVRMITLFDFSKKENAMVVGTENKSELHMGYFTRFGDEASDIEPIQHLYKTQVYELAKYLGLPRSIVEKPPTANLWENQTDEGEFGFKYSEADPVLYLYFDKGLPVEEVEKDFPNAGKIIEFAKKNSYKHHVPYHL